MSQTKTKKTTTMKVQINNYAENSYTRDEVNGVGIYHTKGTSYDQDRDQKVIDCGKGLAANGGGKLIDVSIYGSRRVSCEIEYPIKEGYEVIFPDGWTKVGKIGYQNGKLYVAYDIEAKNVAYLAEHFSK